MADEFDQWASDTAEDNERRVVQLEKQLRRLRSRERVIRDTLNEIFSTPPRLSVPPLPKLKKGKRTETAVAHISDTQLGKDTTSYNMRVARDRLLLYARKVVEITEARRSDASIPELRVYLGGDLVEGENIFPAQAHQIDANLLEQAVKVGPAIFVDMLLYWLKHFERVHVDAVPGNHGFGSRFGHPATNWDTVCAHVARAVLMGAGTNPRREVIGRLSFQIHEGFHFVDRLPGGWGNLVVHGHQIRGGFGGFPFYGVGKKVAGWSDSIDEPWDYLWFGHYHTFGQLVINHRLWLANGTTESGNDYALEQIASRNVPCQRLSFFNASHGLIADHQVFLDKRVPQSLRFKK
jgi:hypothetical protein